MYILFCDKTRVQMFHFDSNTARPEGETPLFWYCRCRGLICRMPLLEQTRFGCHDLKSKTFLEQKQS